jgi:hypothetical protein
MQKFPCLAFSFHDVLLYRDTRPQSFSFAAKCAVRTLAAEPSWHLGL